MGMIPICPGLVGRREGIQERIARGDRALVYAYRTVGPRTVRLKDTVPMLDDVSTVTSSHQQDVISSCETYDARAPQHGRIRQLINNVEIERVALDSSGPVRSPAVTTSKGCRTLLAVIRGPGNVTTFA